MNPGRLCCVGLLVLTQSRCSDDKSAQAPMALMPAQTAEQPSAKPIAVIDAGASAASAQSGRLFPADWCARLGSEDEALLAVIALVDSYIAVQGMECETAGLTTALTRDQESSWINYLIDYTFLLAGCVPNFETVEGGILVFGPANTPYVGAARPRLAPAEAELLTDYYVEEFSVALALTPVEEQALRDYLLQLATEESDPAASSTISTCGVADAGADGAP